MHSTVSATVILDVCGFKEMLLAFVKHWQRVIEVEANRMDVKALATCVFCALCPDSQAETDLTSVLESILTAPPEVAHSPNVEFIVWQPSC
jgi:hypothetical protein